jgi:hypothetical protein
VRGLHVETSVSVRASWDLAPNVMHQQHGPHEDACRRSDDDSYVGSQSQIRGSADRANRQCPCTARPGGGHGRPEVTGIRLRGSGDVGVGVTLETTWQRKVGKIF